jgi:hypothetical protein
VAGTVVSRDEGMTGGLLPEPLVQILPRRVPSSIYRSNVHSKIAPKEMTPVILDKIRRVVEGFNEFIRVHRVPPIM